MVLVHVGVTSVIAHIKIGQMHAALESKVLVVSAQGQCVNIYCSVQHWIPSRLLICKLFVATFVLNAQHPKMLLCDLVSHFRTTSAIHYT